MIRVLCAALRCSAIQIYYAMIGVCRLHNNDVDALAYLREFLRYQLAVRTPAPPSPI